MITFNKLPIDGLILAHPHTFKDERGQFFKLFSADVFTELLQNKNIAQINRSLTKEKGSVRGFHYQLPPYTETKIISCNKGMVFDVALDLRQKSDTFLQWYGIELSAENNNMLIIPEGFAHGFQTLTNDTELLYFHTEKYKPNAEDGIHISDPIINVSWPLTPRNLSDRDSNFKLLSPNFKGI